MRQDGNGSLTNESEGNARDSEYLLRLYLKEVRQYPLLNPNAEKELGCLIWEGRKVFAICSQYGIDPPENLESLFQEAREIMITSNFRWVIKIAFRHRDSHVKPLDFIQQGNLGLMRAVDLFDYKRETRFSTHATPWISQAMLSAYPSQSRTIKVPCYIDELMKKIDKFSQEFAKGRGRFPSDNEIAEGLGRSIELVKECLKLKGWRFLSLNMSPIEKEDRQLENVLADDDALSPEESAYLSHRRKIINELIASVPKSQGDVLKDRLGLSGKEKTLEEIAQEIKKTREWVRQLEKKALTYLRHPSRREKLKLLFEEL